METTTLRLKISSWEEEAYRQLPGGGKLTRADVALSADDDRSSATFEALMFYRPDNTSEYVSLMQFDTEVAGRRGSFTVHCTGTFDGSTAKVEGAVIEDSATGDLAGLTGTMTSTSTHDDYPYMPVTLSCQLP